MGDRRTSPGAVSVARAEVAAAVAEEVAAVVVVVTVSAAEMPGIRHTSIVAGKDKLSKRALKYIYEFYPCQMLMIILPCCVARRIPF